MRKAMTKDRLVRYPKLRIDVLVLKNELHDMNYTEYGIGSSVIADYQKGFPRYQAVTGFDQKRYDKKKRELQNKEKEIKEIEDFIEEIEDGITRKVFKLRYISKANQGKLLSWRKVAKEMGYSDESYPRKKVHDKFLVKIENSPKNPKSPSYNKNRAGA